MARMLVSMLLLASISFTANSLPLPAQGHVEQESNRNSAWPSGSYCIMQMGGSCPAGFKESELRLSVPQDLYPSMLDQKGQNLFRLGTAGDSELLDDLYDNTYTLKLFFCCK